MKFVSICNKLYSKLAGKDVVKIQTDIIGSLEDELASTKRTADIWQGRVNKRDNDIRILEHRINELMRTLDSAERELRAEKNKPDTVVHQFVMTTTVYDKFVKSLEPPVVTNNTTAQGAGYLVGMQRVLEKLRSEFVS